MEPANEQEPKVNPNALQNSSDLAGDTGAKTIPINTSSETTQTVRFDQQQFAEIVAVAKGPQKIFWSFGNVQAIVQVLAIVVGGCWCLYQFFTFQKRNAELQNNGHELTLKQNQLAYEIQGRQVDLRQAQLNHEVALKIQEVELAKLKVVQEKQTIENSNEYKFTRNSSIGATRIRKLDDKHGLFKVSYGIELKNISSKGFEISGFILDGFIGSIRSEIANVSSKAPKVVVQGVPENRWNSGSEYSTAVNWVRVITIGSVHADAIGKISYPWHRAFTDPNIKAGSGMTGYWRPGQSVSFSETFFVRARYGETFSIVANLCFERAKQNNDLWWRADEVELTDEDNPKTGSGAVSSSPE
ncbi:MAG: hypothetical protein JNK23_21810 [Opitutaceae bacterium]|nr:hypothetical protein [Opitutaceae bacterium]